MKVSPHSPNGFGVTYVIEVDRCVCPLLHCSRQTQRRRWSRSRAPEARRSRRAPYNLVDPNISGRTGTYAGYAGRVDLAALSLKLGLNPDIVFPQIAKIVFVGVPLAHA